MRDISNYVFPAGTYVGESSRTKRLYEHEEKAHAHVKQAALEWASLFEVPESEFWQRAMPAELFQVLESFGIEPGLTAAFGYILYWLERQPELVKSFLNKDANDGLTVSQHFVLGR